MNKHQPSRYPDDETRIREENRKLQALLGGMEPLFEEIAAATGGDPSLLSADLKAELEQLIRVLLKMRHGLTDEQVDEFFAHITAEVAEGRSESGA